VAKILIIDDDPSFIGLLAVRLTSQGHIVVSALDGSSGPMIASREKPDLIILDYNMPAANGAVVHERLRGNTFTAGTPIIFLTSTPVGEIITHIKDDDLTRFLHKPVDFALLTKTLAAFLPGAAPAAPAPVPPPRAPAPLPPAPPKRYDPDAPPSINLDVLDLD
jgi:two-component system cell cycle response regulator DivK